jgi:hypothetical protein
MTLKTNRRCVMSGILAAATAARTASDVASINQNMMTVLGSSAKVSATAGAQVLSAAVDQHVLDRWAHRAELKVIADKVGAEFDAAYDALPEHQHQKPTERKRLDIDALGERCDAAVQAFCDVEAEFDEFMQTSVLALGAVLIIAIHDDAEDIPGLNRAALAAVRPQLFGAIAEDADRVLAQREEAA